MGVSYLGIEMSGLTYIAILLFGLIIFVIIMIATERGRQRRHNRERMLRLRQKADSLQTS
jgi:hypothetical protein